MYTEKQIRIALFSRLPSVRADRIIDMAAYQAANDDVADATMLWILVNL